jgi:hypothetical protein
MIWRSLWHVESTGIMAQVLLWIIVAILGALGLSFASPIALAGAGLLLFVLVYRLRYKRL